VKRPAGIRDRVKELRRVRAGDLVANPLNYRRHPTKQRNAVRAALAEIGYADALIARQNEEGKLVLLDGHLRAGLDPEQIVPVLVVDVSEKEGLKVLATLDPLAAMAEQDAEALAELSRRAELDAAELRELVAAGLEEDGSPAPMRPLDVRRPPTLSWVLVGIPTVRFGEIAETMEKVAAIPGVLCEVVLNDDQGAR